MRVMIRKLFSVTNIKLPRNVVRFASSDAKKEIKKEAEKIEPIKSKVIVTRFFFFCSDSFKKKENKTQL